MNKVAKKHWMLCAVLLYIAFSCTCVFSSVMAHYSVTDTATAFARVEPTNYTVYWLVDFDDNSEYTIVAKGTTTNPATEVNKPADPIKEDTEQYDYEFKQWNKTVEGTTITYKAEFTATLRSYTVTFQNWDGTTLQTESVAYGTVPSYTGATPTRANTAQYTYTFTGWSPAVDTVTGAATYTAQYSTTVNTYTVTFKNHDDTILQSTSVAYGSIPSYTGATPTKSSDHTNHIDYTFSGWSPSVTSVTGNATYTAQFGATEYMAPRMVARVLDHVRYLDANKNKIGEACADGSGGSWDRTANVNVDTGIAYLQQWGWISYDAKDKDSFELGYVIDGGSPVYSDVHKYTPEQGLYEAVQVHGASQCVTRYNTYLDVRNLSAGTHNVKLVIKLYGESNYHVVSDFTLKISYNTVVIDWNNTTRSGSSTGLNSTTAGSFSHVIAAAANANIGNTYVNGNIVTAMDGNYPVMYNGAIKLGNINLSHYTQVCITYTMDASAITQERYNNCGQRLMLTSTDVWSNASESVVIAKQKYNMPASSWKFKTAVIDLTSINYSGDVFLTIDYPEGTMVMFYQIWFV